MFSLLNNTTNNNIAILKSNFNFNFNFNFNGKQTILDPTNPLLLESEVQLIYYHSSYFFLVLF